MIALFAWLMGVSFGGFLVAFVFAFIAVRNSPAVHPKGRDHDR